mmetsp:Transcript_19445/g.74652  ORF Transcript_19445/g.74652 Transcript_19445/m.74652 type:complete len:164 (-) Transcript_19445:158-649(-)
MNLNPQESVAVQGVGVLLLAMDHQVFTLWDKDGDDVLNIADLGHAMRSMNLNPQEAELAELRATYDPNGDESGGLTFEQFQQVIADSKAANPDDPAAVIREALYAFDRDENGKVSVPDVQNMLRNLGDKMNDGEVYEIFEYLEADDQGFLPHENWAQLMLNFS